MIFKKTVKEASVTTKLIKHLNSLPNCFARKRHGGAYTSGDPDIHICYCGKTIFIEMKVLEGELSELQAVMMQRWQGAGAVCVLAVWDHENKEFIFFVNKADWRRLCGKVKKHVLDNTESKEYRASKNMEAVLKGWV